MSKLNLLESKRLLRELNYLKCDIEFKNEFTIIYNKQFEIAVKQFLRERPSMIEHCERKFGSQLKESDSRELALVDGEDSVEYSSNTDVTIFSGEIIDMDDDFTLELDEVKLKKLFREIVQNTHPDKVNSNILNSLYSKAVEANKNGDILSMYSVCDELNLDFHVSQGEMDLLDSKIKEIKEKQAQFELSHLWAWYTNDDETKRRNIIQHFLLNHAPKVRHLFQ